MATIQDMPQVKERLAGFWNREKTDRICFAVVAPNQPGAEISMFRNLETGHIENERLKNWTDPDTIYTNAVRRIENTYFGGDAFPVLFSNYGTSGHCNYFGAKPVYEKDTIWFDPCWQSLEQAETAIFNQSILQQHLTLSQALAKKAQGQFFISMPDHCGTADAIGHLYGTENLLMDMIEEPELVKKASSIVNAGWKKANEAFYEMLYPLSENGVAHAWMYLWAPGKLQHMQADISVMLSPANYEEFILPELEEQIEWLDYPVYHFDGIEQTQHLDMILSLKKLKAIQWTHVAGQAPALQHLNVLKRMQQAGKSLIIMTPPEDVPALMKHLDHKGLYLNCETSTADEARQLVDYVSTHSFI